MLIVGSKFLVKHYRWHGVAILQALDLHKQCGTHGYTFSTALAKVLQLTWL